MTLADTCTDLHLPDHLLRRKHYRDLAGIRTMRDWRTCTSRGDKRILASWSKVAVLCRNILENQTRTNWIIMEVRGFLITKAVRTGCRRKHGAQKPTYIMTELNQIQLMIIWCGFLSECRTGFRDPDVPFCSYAVALKKKVRSKCIWKL